MVLDFVVWIPTFLLYFLFQGITTSTIKFVMIIIKKQCVFVISQT